MKNKLFSLGLKLIANGALFMAFFAANSTCNFAGHQDELPAQVNQLRKF